MRARRMQRDALSEQGGWKRGLAINVHSVHSISVMSKAYKYECNKVRIASSTLPSITDNR